MNLNLKSILTVTLAALSTMSFASNPQSVNVIKFGDAKTLFVGDSKSAILYAYSIGDRTNETAQQGYNINDLSSKLAKFAKISPMDIIIRDMAINPTSKEAYIAFDVKTKKGYQSQIVIVNQAGIIETFDLEKTSHTEVQLNDAPTSDVVFWGKTPMRSLTFTDIDFYKGKVYISGMSNAEFSSALRVVDYPFSNSKVTTSSIEIFHAAHNLNETRAPIQTMEFITLEDGDYILAAYTCTPLVLIPVKDLKDGIHLVGKTIAEMGYGNTPVDLIQFKSAGLMDKKPYEGIIVTNRNRSAKFVNFTDITASSKEESIASPGMGKTGGTPIQSLPMTGILQLDDQSNYHIATIRRSAETGELQLHSLMKNVYLRLDEFISEFDQPTYKYEGESGAMVKGFHNMAIKDLGLAPKYLKK